MVYNPQSKQFKECVFPFVGHDGKIMTNKCAKTRDGLRLWCLTEQTLNDKNDTIKDLSDRKDKALRDGNFGYCGARKIFQIYRYYQAPTRTSFINLSSLAVLCVLIHSTSSSVNICIY